MENFKEIKQALIDQDTILVAVTEKIKELKKDERTEQFMIKQFQDVHRDQIAKIIKEAKVILSDFRKEIENLNNFSHAWVSVKTLLGGYSLPNRDFYYANICSDTHKYRIYLEGEIQEIVRIIDWNIEFN